MPLPRLDRAGVRPHWRRPFLLRDYCAIRKSTKKRVLLTAPSRPLAESVFGGSQGMENRTRLHPTTKGGLAVERSYYVLEFSVRSFGSLAKTKAHSNYAQEPMAVRRERCTYRTAFSSHQDFHRRWMAQKRLRACARAVSTGLIHHHEISRLGVGQRHAFGKHVERRAQRSDDIGDEIARRIHAIADCDRIVLAQYLAEVSGRGEVMVQTAVANQKCLAA